MDLRTTTAEQPHDRPVVVIIGVGGMGTAVATRLGIGRQVILADYSEDVLLESSHQLMSCGYDVSTKAVDISIMASVESLVSEATTRGRVEVVVHTAGLSPTMATAERIYAVDLLGTAHIIDAFLQSARPGFTMICISSMAAYGVTLPDDLERHLATAPSSTLLSHPGIDTRADDSAKSYTTSKRGNILRVQAFCQAYGTRGARINSISPGVICTPMGQQEFAGDSGHYMRNIVASSPAKRAGTTADITNAVAFLASPESSFITGEDILVEGGVVHGGRWKVS